MDIVVVLRAALGSLAMLAASALLGTAPAFAQTTLRDPQPVSLGDALTIHSAVLGEDRQVMVHLPRGYVATARYPVLYLLDGSDHFLHVSGVTDFLASRSMIPATIVVGIANTNRSRDLTPPAKNNHAAFDRPAFQKKMDEEIVGAGGADKFLTFLKTELAPAIEAKYSTARFRILAGHSFGGLFGAYVLATDPDAFDGYLLASPSLWWDDQALVRRLAKAMPPLGARPHWLYLSTGEEGGDMLGSLDNLRSVLTIANPERLRWTVRVLPGETHQTTPHRVFYDGLIWLFQDYPLSEDLVMLGDIDRIEAHFAAASRIYGIDLSPSEEMVNGIGYNLMQLLKRPEQAVTAFRRNVAAHPQSPNVHDSLADGLEALGRDREALASRERAVELATAQHDSNLASFAQGRDRLKTKLTATPAK